MTPPKNYVLDADALIRAKRQHYRFCFCPGFWDFLLVKQKAGRLHSIDRVKKQLKPGDDLHEWAYSKAPARFFAPTRAAAVLVEFGKMMFWVNAQAHYTAAAKAGSRTPATRTDGWWLMPRSTASLWSRTKCHPAVASASRFRMSAINSALSFATHSTCLRISRAS